MSKETDDIKRDFNILMNGLRHSMLEEGKLVKENKERILNGLKQLPEKAYIERYSYLVEEKKLNNEKREDFEIREELREEKILTREGMVYKAIDEFLTKLIAVYKPKLPDPGKIKEEVLKSPLKLIDIFEDSSRHNSIMKLLVEKGFCQPNTFIWKDEKKGNKGYLAAILKYLHSQGYYKDNKRPTIEQIQEIASNTFGWSMSIDIIKKTKPEEFELDFIPPASTMS